MDRKSEIRELLKLSPDEVIRRSQRHLTVCENLDALHRHFAQEIAKEIQSEALKRRVIIYIGGVNKSRIKLTLPLWVKKEDIDMIIEKMRDILESIVAD